MDNVQIQSTPMGVKMSECFLLPEKRIKTSYRVSSSTLKGYVRQTKIGLDPNLRSRGRTTDTLNPVMRIRKTRRRRSKHYTPTLIKVPITLLIIN